MALAWSMVSWAGALPGAPAAGPGTLEEVVLHRSNLALQALAERVSPSVVQIQTAGFGSVGEERGAVGIVARQHAIGSGVILDPEGYIITNAHVVQGAQRIRVELAAPAPGAPDARGFGNKVYEAKLVGMDRDTDLALLKIEAHGLPFLRLGADRTARPGEMVLAIGSPEGLRNSITFGIVSSVGRQPNPDLPMEYLQTDAPINHGSSGGPLVDMEGLVIGLNTFILSEGGGSEGLGFAIPARAVKFVYEQLRGHGRVRRLQLDAMAQAITPELAAGLNLAQDWGVVIADVLPGGPADSGGLQSKDVVLTVDGHPIMGLHNFSTALNLHPPDQPVQFVVLRGRTKMPLAIPALVRSKGIEALGDLVDPDQRLGRLGIFGAAYTGDLAGVMPGVRLPSGVLVVALSPDPRAATGELRVGDLIHALNDVPVIVVDDLRMGLRKLQPGAPGVLTVERQGKLLFLTFEMN